MKSSHSPKLIIFLLVFIGHLSAERTLATLSDAEADALVAQEVADKAQRESEHLANTLAFTVLERREADLDGRKLISNRVMDPALPPAKQRRPSGSLAQKTLPARFIQDSAKKNHTVSLSATVHPGEPTVTHLRWRIMGLTDGELEAWSRIDWRLMGGISDLKSETDHYFILLGVGPASYADEVPALPASVDGKAEYFVYADSTDGVEEKAFEVIDLLHRYYELNEPQLKIRYQRQTAMNAARERHETAHPTKPKNAEIYFWKPGAD